MTELSNEVIDLMIDIFQYLPSFEGALCATVDPELFFPEKEGKNELNTAKNICNTCPEFNKCRIFALSNKVPYGIWGGIGRNERIKLLKVVT